MQGEARNRDKTRFGTLCAQLCALRAQDQLENLTNCQLENGFSEHVVNLELVITSLYFQLISVL